MSQALADYGARMVFGAPAKISARRADGMRASVCCSCSATVKTGETKCSACGAEFKPNEE